MQLSRNLSPERLRRCGQEDRTESWPSTPSGFAGGAAWRRVTKSSAKLSPRPSRQAPTPEACQLGGSGVAGRFEAVMKEPLYDTDRETFGGVDARSKTMSEAPRL